MQKNQSKKNKKAKKTSPGMSSGKAIPAANRSFGKKVPSQIVARPDGRIEVRNHEYILDITASPDFQVVSVPINPGLSASFPWLSNIANNYEFYQFKELVVEYRPFVGTTNNGAIMMAVDFDAADPSPINKQRMMSYLSSVQGAIYSPFTLRLNPSDLAKFGTQKFTRPSDVPAGKDIKTYDVGNILIACQTGGGGLCGSIYFRYSVSLMTPHSPQEFPWENSAVITGPGTKATPFSGGVVTGGDTTDPIVEKIDGTDLQFKAGEYIVNAYFGGTGLTTALWNSIVTTTTAGVEMVFDPAFISGGAEGAATAVACRFLVRCAKDFILHTVGSPAWTSVAVSSWKVAAYKYSLG